MTRKLDLASKVWPKDDDPRPETLLYALLGPKGAYTDWHVDMGGSAVWYHLITGSKIFMLAPNTPANVAAFEEWSTTERQTTAFLGESLEKCERVTLRAGDTLFLPSGWPHAVSTPEDSFVLGGNFLHALDFGTIAGVYRSERRLGVQPKFQFPLFRRLMWYAGLDAVNRSQPQQQKRTFQVVGSGSPAGGRKGDGAQKKGDGNVWERRGLPALVQLLKEWLEESGAQRDIPPKIKNVAAFLSDLDKLSSQELEDDEAAEGAAIEKGGGASDGKKRDIARSRSQVNDQAGNNLNLKSRGTKAGPMMMADDQSPQKAKSDSPSQPDIFNIALSMAIASADEDSKSKSSSPMTMDDATNNQDEDLEVQLLESDSESDASGMDEDMSEENDCSEDDEESGGSGDKGIKGEGEAPAPLGSRKSVNRAKQLESLAQLREAAAARGARRDVKFLAGKRKFPGFNRTVSIEDYKEERFGTDDGNGTTSESEEDFPVDLEDSAAAGEKRRKTAGAGANIIPNGNRPSGVPVQAMRPMQERAAPAATLPVPIRKGPSALLGGPELSPQPPKRKLASLAPPVGNKVQPLHLNALGKQEITLLNINFRLLVHIKIGIVKVFVSYIMVLLYETSVIDICSLLSFHVFFLCRCEAAWALWG